MRRCSIIAVLLMAAVLPASATAAKPASFAGSCQFSGPITPMPPITLLPGPGAHFSYRGTGTCSGGVPITVTFRNVATLFDTCELGPDLNLRGVASIGSGRYAITIDLLRLAVAGPFTLTTRHDGRALGIAEFSTAAPQDCLIGGVATAVLSASFQTLSPLVGG